MLGAGSTRWTLIVAAADGDAAAREEFARIYRLAVQTYFESRWGHQRGSADVEDAAQEVFLDCFRDGGALARVSPNRSGGFRAYLYGIARNVARRFEKSRRRSIELNTEGRLDLDSIEADDESHARAFDREWARLLLREAAAHQRTMAREKGDRALRRVELLALRFGEDLPIREIARLWDVDASWLHHQYAQAREEYKRALWEVVRAHRANGTRASVEEECERLLGHLS